MHDERCGGGSGSGALTARRQICSGRCRRREGLTRRTTTRTRRSPPWSPRGLTCRRAPRAQSAAFPPWGGGGGGGGGGARALWGIPATAHVLHLVCQSVAGLGCLRRYRELGAA